MKKKEMTPEKLQKLWVKNLRVWKNINERVRIVEDERGQYIVQTREVLFPPLKKTWSEWYDLHNFSTYKNALKRKHSYIVMILMRDLGYRNEFVRKRTDRKRAKGLI